MKILKRWRWAEKAVWEVKAYDGVMKDGERIFVKLAKTREIKTRELKCVKCIKDEDQRVFDAWGSEKTDLLYFIWF